MKPVVPTSTEAALPVGLVVELRGLITDAREQTAHVVNATLTALHWQIGTRIRQHVLGEERAAYGPAVVASVGKSLSAEFGRGFDEKSLRHMLRFAEAFPDPDIVSALRRELSWTHFKQLIYLDDPLKRDFYAEMCRVERWSTRMVPRPRSGGHPRRRVPDAAAAEGGAPGAVPRCDHDGARQARPGA